MRSLCVTRERLHIATKTQHSQKEIRFKKKVRCIMHYIKVFRTEAFMHLSRVLAVFFL